MLSSNSIANIINGITIILDAVNKLGRFLNIYGNLFELLIYYKEL